MFDFIVGSKAKNVHKITYFNNTNFFLHIYVLKL